MLFNLAVRSFFLPLLFLSSFVFAYDSLDELEAEFEDDTQEQSISQQISAIEKNIDDMLARKEEIKAELANAERDNQATEMLEERLEQIRKQKNDYEALFEKLSLGGLDTKKLDAYIEEDLSSYDWQNELVQIIQPVFKEMQKMTEKPRKLDGLRKEYEYNEQRIALLTEGLTHLEEIDRSDLNKQALERLTSLKTFWETYLNDIGLRQDIVKFELDELTDDSPIYIKIKESLINFIKGRGFVLFASFSTFFIIFYSLTMIMRYFALRRERLGRTRRVNVKWRLMLLAYRVVTVILATIAFLVVLHSLGDMVLFGLAILIIIALIISFRTYIPKYIGELRIFLNLGQARQGERVIYNGIPYRIDRINLYSSYLVNPALDNGRIRLTMNLVRDLVSRPIDHDEIWFPCKVGDSLVLPNGTYVEVIRQTPESVYLDAFASHIIYPTAAFISCTPTNLSQGYYSTVNFGLSYEHRDLAPEYVIEIIEEFVQREFDNAPFAKDVISITSDFRQVNEGISILYTCYAHMSGSGAGWYYSVPRRIQRGCFKAAQHHGWNMPFTEISIRGKGNTVDPDDFPKGVKILDKAS